MKLHPVIACAALSLLGACTTFRAPGMAYDGGAPIASGFTPVASATVPLDFCRASVANDRLRLASHGFDTPTLERITAQSLNQCNVIVAGYPVTDNIRMASR